MNIDHNSFDVNQPSANEYASYDNAYYQYGYSEQPQNEVIPQHTTTQAAQPEAEVQKTDHQTSSSFDYQEFPQQNDVDQLAADGWDDQFDSSAGADDWNAQFATSNTVDDWNAQLGAYENNTNWNQQAPAIASEGITFSSEENHQQSIDQQVSHGDPFNQASSEDYISNETPFENQFIPEKDQVEPAPVPAPETSHVSDEVLETPFTDNAVVGETQILASEPSQIPFGTTNEMQDVDSLFGQSQGDQQDAFLSGFGGPDYSNKGYADYGISTDGATHVFSDQSNNTAYGSQQSYDQNGYGQNGYYGFGNAESQANSFGASQNYGETQDQGFAAAVDQGYAHQNPEVPLQYDTSPHLDQTPLGEPQAVVDSHASNFVAPPPPAIISSPLKSTAGPVPPPPADTTLLPPPLPVVENKHIPTVSEVPPSQVVDQGSGTQVPNTAADTAEFDFASAINGAADNSQVSYGVDPSQPIQEINATQANIDPSVDPNNWNSQYDQSNYGQDYGSYGSYQGQENGYNYQNYNQDGQYNYGNETYGSNTTATQPSAEAQATYDNSYGNQSEGYNHQQAYGAYGQDYSNAGYDNTAGYGSTGYDYNYYNGVNPGTESQVDGYNSASVETQQYGVPTESAPVTSNEAGHDHGHAETAKLSENAFFDQHNASNTLPPPPSGSSSLAHQIAPPPANTGQLQYNATVPPPPMKTTMSNSSKQSAFSGVPSAPNKFAPPPHAFTETTYAASEIQPLPTTSYDQGYMQAGQENAPSVLSPQDVDLKHILCPSCNKKIDRDSFFCNKCGGKVPPGYADQYFASQQQQQAAPPPTTTVVQQQPPITQPGPVASPLPDINRVSSASSSDISRPPPPMHNQYSSPGAVQYNHQAKDPYRRSMVPLAHTDSTDSNVYGSNDKMKRTSSSSSVYQQMKIQEQPPSFVDPLGRHRGHAIAVFGFGGKLIITKPRRQQRLVIGPNGSQSMVEKSCAGEVSVVSAQSLLADKGILEHVPKFPGPLLGGKNKLKKKDILKLADDGIKVAEEKLNSTHARYAANSNGEALMENAEVELQKLNDGVILWKLLKLIVDSDGVIFK
jgi:hypothetical protein